MKYYSTSEVAAMLGLAVEAILKRIVRGHLKANKIGGVYIITSEDLKKSKVNPVGRPPKK
jgi:excisionase family DNA binding protein